MEAARNLPPEITGDTDAQLNLMADKSALRRAVAEQGRARRGQSLDLRTVTERVQKLRDKVIPKENADASTHGFNELRDSEIDNAIDFLKENPEIEIISDETPDIKDFASDMPKNDNASAAKVIELRPAHKATEIDIRRTAEQMANTLTSKQIEGLIAKADKKLSLAMDSPNPRQETIDREQNVLLALTKALEIQQKRADDEEMKRLAESN